MPRPRDLPSEEEFQDWLQQPVTQLLRAWARSRKQELMEKWARGEFSAAFTTEMLAKNAGATGACSVLEEVIEPVFQKLIDEVSDDKSEWTEAPRPGGSH